MVELGDEARCIVTGFKGIVSGRFEWLNGCVRCQLQPRVGKDGKFRESKDFDIEQLEVVRKRKVVIAKKRKPIGGPMPTPMEY